MKIRCGSHQQNRSIVRPGLSLMAAKVALTAEEFRENSQRSIDLFNTEKLSTDSTRVLKSVYCNSVHFCRCNLHGACGGKAKELCSLAIPRSCNLHGACGGKEHVRTINVGDAAVAICTERVEAKDAFLHGGHENRCCNLHGACGGKVLFPFLPLFVGCCNLHGACGGKVLLLRQVTLSALVAICTERVEAKLKSIHDTKTYKELQSARSVWRQRKNAGLG